MTTIERVGGDSSPTPRNSVSWTGGRSMAFGRRSSESCVWPTVGKHSSWQSRQRLRPPFRSRRPSVQQSSMVPCPHVAQGWRTEGMGLPARLAEEQILSGGCCAVPPGRSGGLPPGLDAVARPVGGSTTLLYPSRSGVPQLQRLRRAVGPPGTTRAGPLEAPERPPPCHGEVPSMRARDP